MANNGNLQFFPAQEELVMDLVRKMQGLPAHNAMYIFDHDVHREEPWTLPQNVVYDEPEGVFYYFSRPQGKIEKRPMGTGYWHQIDELDDVMGVGYQAHRKMYRYLHGEKEKKTNWVMTEYRLTALPPNATYELVLCALMELEQAF